jgi:hypothetical protein
METNIRIRRNIMRRVFFWYTVRTVTSPLAKLGAFFAVSFVLGAAVSVRDVLQNAWGALASPLQFGRFMVDAFVTTEFVVQVVVVVGFVVVLALLVDIYRTYKAGFFTHAFSRT